MESPRWNIITPSQYEHERRALDFIRAGLPDHDPYRAWSNFEFQTSDGAIYEVDLLVLTKQGFWLVEIKSWPGRVTGDAGTWTRTHEGRTVSEDNPVNLANRKAKALSSLLKRQKSAFSKVQVPWLDAVVFLSAEELQCELAGAARNRVLLRDRAAHGDRPKRDGILEALISRVGPGINPDQRSTIDITVAKALSRAMESAGIRPSQRSRRVGDYVLGDLIEDGPGYQDRLAKHVAFKDESVYCRVRQYTVAQAATEESRKKLQRAAAREFQIIQTLNHPGILPVLDYKDHELGPALLFRYTDPKAERFDHYLARKGTQLTTDQRLNLLRQVTDAIRYAHSKRVVHRALGPQSVLVTDAEETVPVLQVYNWQVGVQQTKGSSARVTNIDDLVETHSLVYMSPEALADSRKVSEAADIFSLGAIAFHLFTSRPPAGSLSELTQILKERNGLSVSAAIDGAGPKLEEFIRWSTHPDALTRIGTVEEFLTLLDGVEDELTSPDASVEVDPLKAKRGDRLQFGYTVERVLGQGATARALLVQKDEKEYVLKVALTENDNARLKEEAGALKKVRSEFVIAIYDTLEIAGRTVLVLQKAGEESLAIHLRKYGVPALDLLARYGEHLLAAVASLERHGVVHRDIKPDNIGIHSINKQQNQLILYDFSLTSAPLDNLFVGTADYRDPFLKNRKSRTPKWDLAAERYSAGVTLYEMCVGDNQLPKWGKDDSTDPSVTKDELVLDVEKFKSSVREGLTAFFKKALHRDSEKRYDNAEEMRKAWQRVFTDAENQTVKTPSGEQVTTSIPLDQAELETLVAALDLSARARDALDGLSITTVKELLRFPTNDIHMMRGVGDQFRREIIGLVADLRQRFPDVSGRKTSVNEDDTTPSLERLHSRVVGTRTDKNESEWAVRAGLFNVAAPAGSPTDVWPSQFDVADALKVTRATVGQALAADQRRWGKDSLVSGFRNELFDQCQRLGGVATIAELIDFTLLLRPPTETLDPERQRRLASAIARAAIETEGGAPEPRIQIRRSGTKTVVACTQELASYAETLGATADRLAKADPLLPRLRVFQELYDVPQPPPVPGCQPFSNERLVKLAAAMSDNAAVSSQQELYPRRMHAERALRLGIGALSGLGLGNTNEGFKIAEVQARVKSRYPEAEPLPDDPRALEAMLQRVGIDVQWNSADSAFHRRDATILNTSGSAVGVRRTTATSTRHNDSSSPEKVQARADESRLQHAFTAGGFLVLTVRPSRMRDCERELVHRFEFDRVSFDDLLFKQLKAKSKEYEFPWSDIYEADAEARTTDDWRNLIHLVGEVTPSIATDLMGRPGPTLLVHPGLIARYGQMSLLQTLRDRIGHDAKCPTLWVLVGSDNRSEMPFLDGAQIPLISTGQRAYISENWIDNLHRGRDNEVVAGKKQRSRV